LWAKFQILTVLGLYSHISAPISVKFGMGKQTCAKFHIYQGKIPACAAHRPAGDRLLP